MNDGVVKRDIVNTTSARAGLSVTHVGGFCAWGLIRITHVSALASNNQECFNVYLPLFHPFTPLATPTAGG